MSPCDTSQSSRAKIKGLWIAAPISRAVNDKAAKSLLGESFKRQLKYDSAYSRVTFICTKTDDISITEASDSLDLGGVMFENWAKVDQIKKDIRTLQESVEELEDSKGVCEQILNDVKHQLKIWQLEHDLGNGKDVVALSDISKKRKHLAKETVSNKRCNYSPQSLDGDDDTTDTNTDDTIANSRSSVLTSHDIKDEITELKLMKRGAYMDRADLVARIKGQKQEVESLVKAKSKIEAEMIALCIASRNHYSRHAIQQDFAAGVKEMDHGNAAEEDENFNPDDDFRDYDEVARSLSVFCVSSRAYQKLSGRLQRDFDVPGFQSSEETEVTFEALNL